MVLMGLGQESGREGEVVSWEAGESARVRVAISRKLSRPLAAKSNCAERDRRGLLRAA